MSDEVKLERTLLTWEMEVHDDDVSNIGSFYANDGWVLVAQIDGSFTVTLYNEVLATCETPEAAKVVAQSLQDALDGLTYEAGISEGKRLAIENRSVVAGELTPKDEK